MSGKACDLSGNCGACRRKVSQGVFCESCKCWFHWACSNTVSDDVRDCNEWFCECCRLKELVRKHEETISNLRKELEFVKKESKGCVIAPSEFLESKSPGFKVPSRRNLRRKRRFSADDQLCVKLSNRFSVLETDDQSPNPPVQVLDEVGTKSKVLLLGSSHGRGIASLLKEDLGNHFDVLGIVKPSAGLSHVTEDLVKLTSGFTKRDHVVIVGGPGNSLDGDSNYSIEKDLCDVSESSSHTNVKVVGLFQRHDKPQLHRRVREMNLRLERALLSPAASHIDMIDVSGIDRDAYTSHGLHLNSRGKKQLSQLIADRIIGRIPVVTSTRTFLG